MGVSLKIIISTSHRITGVPNPVHEMFVVVFAIVTATRQSEPRSLGSAYTRLHLFFLRWRGEYDGTFL